MMNEQVRTIMTRDPVVVRPHQTIEEVSNLMLKKRLQQLPVVDEKNHLVGLITSYDLWRKSDLNSKRVADVMTEQVLTISPIDKVGTAAELFIDRRFKTLPVVNLRNELKGIVTAFDVIKYNFLKEYPQPILYRDVLLEQGQSR